MDLHELELAIGSMSNRTELYRTLKQALSKRGYWKNQPRGNARKGYNNSPITQSNKLKRFE